MTLEDIQQTTEVDAEMQTLIKAIESDRWTSPEVQDYIRLKDEFSVYHGIVLRMNRILIPPTLRSRAVELAHLGHQGIVKTKQLFRDKVWFPGIDKPTEEKSRQRNHHHQNFFEPAKAVVPKLDGIFSRQGVSDILKSDNAPPFNGHEFKNFADYLGFKHRKITPLWPKENGGAQRLVETLEKNIRIAHIEGKNWKLCNNDLCQ